MKKNKQSKSSLLVALVACFALTFGISVAGAQSSRVSFWDAVKSEVAEILAGRVSSPVDEPTLGGGSRYENSYLYAGEGLYADGDQGLGVGTFTEAGLNASGVFEEARIVDGYRQRLVTITLDATSSAVAVNPESETIFVYDASIRVQDATSTAIAYQAGTSTASGIHQGGTCGATGTCGAATAGHASIINTGTAAATTDLQTFWKLDFQGTDTRDGSGVRYVVPVASGEYLSCNASTTPAANGTLGGQGVQCQFHYYVLED